VGHQWRTTALIWLLTPFARRHALVPLTSSLVAPLVARGVNSGLYCDHCGRDGHVETFCYKKRKAQKAQIHHSL
jgi:hypothetical protein